MRTWPHLKSTETGLFWRLYWPFEEKCRKSLILTLFLFILRNKHKMAYFDDLMFYFGKNTPYAVFWHFCCSFKEKSTVCIILTTFLDILKNRKRQNGPYPFWRARALIWKLHTKGYNEDFSAHFNTMSCICLFWWAFWAIHIQTWLSLKAQSSRFWKASQAVNVLICRGFRAYRSLFWTEIQATWLFLWTTCKAYFEA